MHLRLGFSIHRDLIPPRVPDEDPRSYLCIMLQNGEAQQLALDKRWPTIRGGEEGFHLHVFGITTAVGYVKDLVNNDIHGVAYASDRNIVLQNPLSRDSCEEVLLAMLSVD